MKILYDSQIFLAQKHGGISRYYYELATSSETDVETEIAVLYHRNEYLGKVLKSLPLPPKTDSFLGGRYFPGRNILVNIKEKVHPSIKPIVENQNKLLEQIAQRKFDLFHPTYYNNYFLRHIHKTPFVLTIYDMIHELYPEYFMGDKTALLKRQLFDNAQHVITISETTKNDIVQFYNCSVNKVEVVHLASSLISVEQQDSLKHLKIPENYILFVGDRRIYKNFLFFVNAIASLLKANDELFLICTGRHFSDAEIEFFEQQGLAGKIMQIFASDEELVALYSNARVFVFPSLYEGFGLPVLEAFSCGCPAVLSHTGSLPEIAGDAALYFDPKSVSDIRNTINKVLSSDSLRENLIQKGKQQLNKYSWSKTVKETHKIYRKIIH